MLLLIESNNKQTCFYRCKIESFEQATLYTGENADTMYIHNIKYNWIDTNLGLNDRMMLSTNCS